MKSILYIGDLHPGTTSTERMKAMRDLGYSMQTLNSSVHPGLMERIAGKICGIFGLIPDFHHLNRQIRQIAWTNTFDLLWIDKGVLVKPSTLLWIKSRQPGCRLVHFNPDDPFGAYRKGWAVFLKAIPHYDVHFVARQQNLEEFARLGGKNIHAYDRSFSPQLHRPVELTEEEKEKYGAPVGFIGTYARDRAGAIAHLIQNGIPVAVYGNGWPGQEYWDTIRPHYRGPSRFGEEYVRVINGMGIALHFLRRENRDEQDSRSFEIPACGVCMIAERSPKHETLFEKDTEAVFFDTPEELLEKVRYYLAHPEQARHIGAAGRRRSIRSGYDHLNRMKSLLDIATRIRPS